MPCSQVTPWFFFEIIEIKQFHLPLLYNLQIKYFVSSPLHTFCNSNTCGAVLTLLAELLVREKWSSYSCLFLQCLGLHQSFVSVLEFLVCQLSLKRTSLKKTLKKKRPNSVKAWSWRPGHLWNIEYFWWVFLSSVSSGKKGFWTMGSHANAYLTTNYLDK